MKDKIRLTNCDQYASVDPEDYDRVSKEKWHRSREGYAQGAVKFNGKWKMIFMHNFIIGKSALDTDHINRNKLDNRKSNLRKVTRSQNNINNIFYSSNKSSKVRGITYHKRNKRWRSRIIWNGKHVSLGCYKTIGEALGARVTAELGYYGLSPWL